MVSESAMPELNEFLDENGKIKKDKDNIKINYYVHIETKNTSFIKVHKLLELLGIKNNTFMLALYDVGLKDVDPYDKNLDTATKIRVLKECQRNYWYFIREVVILAVSGGTKHYELHRGNCAMSFCFLNGFNSFTELPRQTYKSMSVDVFLLWLYNFGTRNSDIGMFNLSHSEAKNNLKRIKEIRDTLPDYLRFNKKFNEENKELKVQGNVNSSFNEKTHNNLITVPSATSKEKAEELGRGRTQPIQWMDEFAFMRYNMIIFAAAAPANRQASAEAERLGKPHCQIITTTPGDMATEFGKDADDFRKLAEPFSEGFYDWKPKKIKEFLRRASKTRYFHIVFDYKQLGKDENYLSERLADAAGNYMKLRREALLQWVTVNDSSPFDIKDLEELNDMVKTPIDRIYVDKYYYMEIYERINKNIPYILGVDVATGQSRDNSTIAVINPQTKACVGEFKCATIDTLAFSHVILTLVKNVFPKACVVIEKNLAAVVTNLVRTEIKGNLYYEDNTNELKQKMPKGFHSTEMASRTKLYGLWTSAERKAQMHEILLKYVAFYKKRVATKMLTEEISALIYNKKGIIDHTENGHDDLVMAYLIGLWVYYYGTNLGHFGIIRYPDVDPETGLTEEEAIRMQEEAQREKDLSIANANKLLHVDDSDSETNYGEYTIEKDINEFYEESAREDIRGYNRSQKIQNTGMSVDDYYGNLNNGLRMGQHGGTFMTTGIVTGSRSLQEYEDSGDMFNDMFNKEY